MSAPNTPASDEDLHALAVQQLKERSDFRWHLITYVVINGMFWVLWAWVSGVHTHPWPIWITLFWGVALAFHWGYASRRRINQATIQAELDRMRGQ